MKPFGEFILRSQRNAALLALAFAALPIFNWLAVIIMALVTLRKGVQAGGIILLCVILPAVVWMLIDQSQLAVFNVALGAVVVWLLAAVLYKTYSWTWVLVAAALIAMVAIAILHGYIDNINAWWQQKMLSYLQAVNTDMQVDVTQQKAAILQLAKIATGIQAGAILLINAVWLVMARYWQAVLFNPGKLRSELHGIRMPQWTSLLLVVIVGLAALTKWPVIIDMLPALMVVFALAGLSLAHFIVAARQLHWILLLVFYAALIFALPYMGVALVMIALSDSLFNIRSRYTKQTSK